jgi:large subunit ribosomal protein L13
MYKTYYPKLNDVQQDWYVVDAQGMVLGRLASQIASVLRGKNKPYFTPHLDTGDYIVVVNADKIRLTGKKSSSKSYFSHSGYLGGEKFIEYKDMLKNHPKRILEHAVKGMLPHNTLGRKLIKKLKIYTGPEHPHEAQQPKPLELEG